MTAFILMVNSYFLLILLQVLLGHSSFGVMRAYCHQMYPHYKPSAYNVVTDRDITANRVIPYKFAVSEKLYRVSFIPCSLGFNI
jgi:hypothetical protein